MATREMALCIALSGATATAAAQTATATENWLPIGRPGPNGHWSRDVRAERNHLSEREVLTPGPRWPDVVQARSEKQEGLGRPLQGHPTG